MKATKLFLAGLVLLAVGGESSRATIVSRDELVGTWKLVKIDHGPELPADTNFTLTFGERGNYSCEVTQTGSASKMAMESGTWKRVGDNQVVFTVAQGFDASLVGVEETDTYEKTGNQLKLTSTYNGKTYTDVFERSK